MARRKKKFDVFKKIGSYFKIKKRTQKKLLTLGLITVIFFAIWVYHTSKTKQAPHRPSAPKANLSKPSLPAPIKRPVSKINLEKTAAAASAGSAHISKTAAQPIVYYKTVTLPTPAKQNTQPLLQQFSNKPKIVLIIDDIGNTASYSEELTKLGSDVTYAILPLLPHTSFFDRLSLRTRAEVILHLPLESYKGTIPGPGLITTNMSDERVLEEIQRNLNSVPHAVGANNHMGSKGTSDPRLMDIILSELKRRDLIFLDSRTTSQSVAPLVGRELNLPILKRTEFLDNEDNVAAIQRQLGKLAAAAQRTGAAIGIGHYRLNTLKVFQEEIPKLKSQGFEIISLKELLHYKQSGR